MNSERLDHNTLSETFDGMSSGMSFRLRSLLRKIVCQLSASDYVERPPPPNSTPAEQELPGEVEVPNMLPAEHRHTRV